MIQEKLVAVRVVGLLVIFSLLFKKPKERR